MKKKKLNLEISEIGPRADESKLGTGLPGGPCGPCGPCGEQGIEGIEASVYAAQASANSGMMYVAAKNPLAWFSYSWATKCSGKGQTAKGALKGGISGTIATFAGSKGNPAATLIGTGAGTIAGGINECIDCHI